MTIMISVVWIPITITVLGLFWALFIVKSEGVLAGLDNLVALIPVLFISMISWIIYAIFK